LSSANASESEDDNNAEDSKLEDSDDDNGQSQGRWKNDDLAKLVPLQDFRRRYLSHLIHYIGHSDDIWIIAPAPFMEYAEKVWKHKFPAVKAIFEQGHIVYDLVRFQPDFGHFILIPCRRFNDFANFGVVSHGKQLTWPKRRSDLHSLTKMGVSTGI
jgi:hypothetical protein